VEIAVGSGAIAYGSISGETDALVAKRMERVSPHTRACRLLSCDSAGVAHLAMVHTENGLS
jgi:hypothetical protein